MGRYDAPYFFTEDENVVSVWVVAGPRSVIPADYFEENYSDDDEEPFNRFSAEFGFGYYDHDYVEMSFAEEAESASLQALLARVSFAQSFREAALRQAVSMGVFGSGGMVMMYNFKYRPEVTGIRQSEHMRFLGVFAYTPDV